MSTVSEVDIRDWDKIDLQPIRKAKELLHNTGFIPTSIDLDILLNKLELIRDKQLREAQKQIAAVLRKP